MQGPFGSRLHYMRTGSGASPRIASDDALAAAMSAPASPGCSQGRGGLMISRRNQQTIASVRIGSAETIGRGDGARGGMKFVRDLSQCFA